MTAKTRCASCTVRPITNDSPESQLCTPCLREAEWENSHSDNGHAGLADGSLTWKQTNYKTKKAFDAWVADESKTMEQCWICHPELNEAQREYTPRNGSSREGMRMTVRRGAAPQEKAALVEAAILGTGRGTAKVTTRKGVTTLKGTIGDTPVELRWEGRSFVAGRFNGRAVRNVSEALRLVAA
jgi:hypothetical protein